MAAVAKALNRGGLGGGFDAERLKEMTVKVAGMTGDMLFRHCRRVGYMARDISGLHGTKSTAVRPNA